MCYEHLAHLVVFHHYLSEMPRQVKKDIQNIIDSIDEAEKSKKLYFEYLKSFHRNQIFKEYQTYMLINRSSDIVKDIPNLNSNNFSSKYDEVLNAMQEYRRVTLALIFNILSETPQLFNKRDFIENIPQLIYWIQNNIDKPIKNLENDDCEILAACFASLSYDEMLNNLNLSSFTKDYSGIYKRLQNIPDKFGVQNLTQVMFRIILLKPVVWQQGSMEEIVKAIKGIADAI